MKLAVSTLLIVCVSAAASLAAVDPIVVRVPESKAWMGQRVSFFVDIRVSGSFGGATTFSLPEVPGTIILGVGNASVSSKEIDGKEWFVQTHEFSLFSQTTGEVVVPAFPVRYGMREGFSGPVTEVEGKVPSLKVEIERPPGTKGIGFLITTDSLSVSENWDPMPGTAKVGSVFKRTIRQQADQVLGMALPPVPRIAPDGIHVYVGDPTVNDSTERGAFVGTRSETLTYLMEKAGTYTLPAIKFIWWNPKSEQLELKELPTATFDVAASPQTSKASKSESHNRWYWIVALVAISVLLVAIRAGASWLYRVYNTPERVASRQLLRACRQNDAKGAYEAWLTLPKTESSPGLNNAIYELTGILYSERSNRLWDGRKLTHAFRNAKREPSTRSPAYSCLPLLNP